MDAPPPSDPSAASSAPSPSKRSRPAPPPVLRPTLSEPTRRQDMARVARPSTVEAGASSSGAKGDDETEERYFGAFTARFAFGHQTWADEVHKPQTAAEYRESLKTDQTTTCSTLAASHYQKKKGVVLKKIKGLDSHMFHCKWVSPDEKRFCVHVNFWAFVVGGREKGNLFFSEVVGSNFPESVNSCLILDTSNSSLKNCKFCTGMWHPLTGGFFGCKNLPPPI